MWWETALDVFPKHNIPFLNAILLTHSHFDAIGGLDDIRDLTCNIIKGPLPIYLDNETLSVCKSVFTYIFGGVSSGGGGVSKIEYELFEHYKEFQVEDLKIIACPVNHGSINCNGFEIGDLLYVSDIKVIDDKIIEKMKNKNVVILDCLKPFGTHPSHFTYDDLVKFLPKLTTLNVQNIYLTGFCHKIDHDEFSKQVSEISFYLKI